MLQSKKRYDDDDGNKASNHLAPLVKARLAIINETSKDKVYNTANAKALSSDSMGELDYRVNYGDDKELESICKIVINTNEENDVSGDSKALSDRVFIYRFPIRFVDNPTGPFEMKADRTLGERLIKYHLDAFASWMVQGAINWYAEGLSNDIPEEVAAEIEHFKLANDTVGKFIEEKMDFVPEMFGPRGGKTILASSDKVITEY